MIYLNKENGEGLRPFLVCSSPSVHSDVYPGTLACKGFVYYGLKTIPWHAEFFVGRSWQGKAQASTGVAYISLPAGNFNHVGNRDSLRKIALTSRQSFIWYMNS